MNRRFAAFVLCGLVVAAGTARAATIAVPAGGNLQAALNQAQPGDAVLLAAGATFTGNFVLPPKSGSGYITIRSDAPDASLPAAGQRITPVYSQFLPKLQAPAGAGGVPPLATAPYAAYYVIQFVEFLPNPSGVGSLLALGSADSSQNSLDVVPHDIVVDRCYLHAAPGVPQLRGVALNSGKTTIRDSYIAEIKAAGSDSQAIAGWNGPGPYTILNNYLEAAGENFLLGGSSMFIANVTPTGIDFRNNYVTKQQAWRGSQWTVKNLFELKHAQDVTVDGNVFEYNWVAAQPGYAILFTPRNQYGDNLWSVVQRVGFTNNLVRHVSSAINILGWDNEHPSQQTNHLAISNNVFEDVSGANWGGDGRMIQISETPDVTVDHNTVFNSGSILYAYNTTNQNFVFTNNIASAASYGISGGSTGGVANTAISMYFPGGVVRDNLFVACPSPWEYPAGNYFPATYDAVGFANLAAGDYHLSSSSAYTRTGTDGRDPGADIDALIAALSGTAVPSRPPAGDAAPVVSLVSPTDGTSYAAPATIRCSADASDSDQTPVARVDFYANGTLACSATAAPFTCSWSGVAAGSYSITATAFDAAGLRATSAASAITVVGASASLPAPWIDQDVGAVGLAGSASYANDRFTVRGAGADVWGTADGFNFVHQALSGDGQVVARVLSLQNTNALAKAGVMVRASLAADSANVLLDLKPDGGMELLARQSNGGSTRVVSSGAAAMGAWLRLVRSGSKLTASTSIDGSHWTTVGSTSITLGQAAYVGIVVCSHATGLLDTAAFDNVTVTAARAKAQPRKSIFSAVPPRQGRPRVRR